MHSILQLLTNIVKRVYTPSMSKKREQRMPKQTNDKVFVNTLMEKEMVEQLDAVAEQYDRPRGWMVRLLVRKGLEGISKKQNVSSKKLQDCKE
jgi:predicted DNA-binding protein